MSFVIPHKRGEVSWNSTASKHKGDMWRTWDALKGRPALMFPDNHRKQLEAEQAALDAEADTHEQAQRHMLSEVQRATEHARMANFKREETQMALEQSEAQVQALVHEMDNFEARMAEKAKLEQKIVLLETRNVEFNIRLSEEKRKWDEELVVQANRHQGQFANTWQLLEDEKKRNAVLQNEVTPLKAKLADALHAKELAEKEVACNDEMQGSLQAQLRAMKEQAAFLQHQVIEDFQARSPLPPRPGFQAAFEADSEHELKAELMSVTKERNELARSSEQYKADRDRAMFAKEKVVQEAKKVQQYLETLEAQLTCNDEGKCHSAGLTKVFSEVEYIRDLHAPAPGTYGHPVGTYMYSPRTFDAPRASPRVYDAPPESFGFPGSGRRY